MKHGEVDAGRLGRRDQRRLSALQRPARRRDAGVLVAVGVPEHHHLATAAALEVSAIPVVRQERAQYRGGRREVVHRLEQRRDVERERTVRSDEARPPREQEHAEYVVHALGHAHDVGADGGRAVARPALGDRPEHPERPLGVRVGCGGGRFGRLQRTAQPVSALCGRALEPPHVAQQTPRHHPVDERVLAHVEGGQVEAKGLHAPDETSHSEQPRVNATMGLETSAHHLEVGRELGGVRIPLGVVPLRGGEPCGHQAEQHSVRHIAVARGYLRERGGEPAGVARCAFQHGLLHARTGAGLG